jgi:hypothetical protein
MNLRWTIRKRVGARAARLVIRLIPYLVVIVGLVSCTRPPASAGATFSGFQAQYLSYDVPTTMHAGADHNATLTVKNLSDATWPSRSTDGGSANVVVVSYHWFPAEGQGDRPIMWEGKRSALPKDVGPGETVTVEQVTVAAPPNPGAYRLSLTLLNELIGWFDERNVPPLVVPIVVE